MRLGHLLGQILPIVQNASAASTVTGGFCLFSQVSLPGSEILDPGSSREFPGIPTPGNSHFRSLAYYTPLCRAGGGDGVAAADFSGGIFPRPLALAKTLNSPAGEISGTSQPTRN